MSVSTRNQTMKGTTKPFRFYQNTSSYDMLRRRTRDEAWLYGWLWRPIKRVYRSVTSLDAIEYCLLALLIVLVLMLLFCVFMAFMSAFNMPQHNEIVAVIEVGFAR